MTVRKPDSFRGRAELGSGFAEGVHPDDLPRCVSHYEGCFERRIAFAMSYRLQNAAGQYQWILDRGASHRLPDRTFPGFFGGCADVETASAITRKAELGPSIPAEQKFADGFAVDGVAAMRPAEGATKVSLQESCATPARNSRSGQVG